ncbi:hypothetical protein YC2023_076840 [Brassica napus]|uniref:(rape) hypothetical protein n=1 Tax=Brassica napus TaxID=3708 RepID=A0A816Q4Q5_BRANA|nr:unnamed protein product [Brassica napus]
MYGLRGTGFCGTGPFAGWTETGHAGLMNPHFFLHFLFYLKNEKDSEKKTILVTFPPENIRSSGDDDSSSGDNDSSSGDNDSSSGDDDSSSSDDDSSSGGVLIWFSRFITHNYELLYYNVIFLV